MPPRSEEELQKHTFHLYKGDYQKLQELYPDLGAAIIIRNLVRKYLTNIENKTETTTQFPEVPNVEINSPD